MDYKFLPLYSINQCSDRLEELTLKVSTVFWEFVIIVTIIIKIIINSD